MREKSRLNPGQKLAPGISPIGCPGCDQMFQINRPIGANGCFPGILCLEDWMWIGECGQFVGP